jgi:hypothetical protein
MIGAVQVYPRLPVMKIDITYDAGLQALVETIREQQDHGKALMSLVSRLVDEASRQDWFEAHWRTDARLTLAQLACSDMPKRWRSAAPVLDVIAEAARWALKADDIDSDSRATLLAITRLAEVERSGQTAAASKPRPVAKAARRRTAGKVARKAKANGRLQARRGRPTVSLAKPAGSAKSAPATKVRKATKAARMAKANGQLQARRARPTLTPAKPAGSTKSPPTAKVRKTAKAKVKAPVAARQAHPTLSIAKPAKPVKSPPTAKVRPTAKAKVKAPAKALQARPTLPLARPAEPAKSTPRPAAKAIRKAKVKAPAKARRSATLPIAKPAQPVKSAPTAKVRSVAKPAPAPHANGAGQASQTQQTSVNPT